MGLNLFKKIKGKILKQQEGEPMQSDFTANPNDWDLLAHKFLESGNIVFPYVLQGGGALIINLNQAFEKLGVMPFGGNPDNRIYVSIFQRGCDHFGWNLAGEAEVNSLKARLNLHELEARDVVQLFKALSERINRSE